MGKKQRRRRLTDEDLQGKTQKARQLMADRGHEMTEFEPAGEAGYKATCVKCGGYIPVGEIWPVDWLTDSECPGERPEISEEGKAALAKAYEILLGKEVMDAIAAISCIDEKLGLALMKNAVKAKLGERPPEEAKAELDRLVDDYIAAQSSSS